ncbi:MAG TPA: efflux RND transporter periplasmic adaptor subunit [Gemmatimonadales bacterium]|nr:efflux RND transporter periplasmic adaptor subunit [Gemmatimonadales bacterium]
MSRKLVFGLIGLAIVAVVVFLVLRSGSSDLMLTGVVTTNDVIVSPQVGGQVSRLLVAEGDTVEPGQLIAVIAPAELKAEQTFYAHSADALSAQVTASAAALAAAEAQDSEAKANVANARLTYQRDSAVAAAGGLTPETLDQARTAFTVAQARADAAEKQVAAARSALQAARQQRDAAAAQATRADVRLGYTEVRAPIAGIVDVRAVQQGEVVTAGQPVVTLINPDSLWVRADVEESYIDRIRLGDTLTVRLPSGAELPGVVYFRGVDAAFATQRDVSRTKRDIKTFEFRLRVNNTDRRLAVGMTTYVLLPLSTTKP